MGRRMEPIDTCFFDNYKRDYFRWYRYHPSRTVQGALNCAGEMVPLPSLPHSSGAMFKDVPWLVGFVQVRAPWPVQTSPANPATPSKHRQDTELPHSSAHAPGNKASRCPPSREDADPLVTQIACFCATELFFAPRRQKILHSRGMTRGANGSKRRGRL